MLSLEDFYMPYDTLETKQLTIDDFTDAKPNSGMFLSTVYDNDVFYLDLQAPETHTGKRIDDPQRIVSSLTSLEVPFEVHKNE